MQRVVIDELDRRNRQRNERPELGQYGRHLDVDADAMSLAERLTDGWDLHVDSRRHPGSELPSVTLEVRMYRPVHRRRGIDVVRRDELSVARPQPTLLHVLDVAVRPHV